MLNDMMIYLGRIEEQAKNLDRSQLLVLGTRLNEVVTAARIAYREAAEKSVSAVSKPVVEVEPEPAGPVLPKGTLVDGTYTVIFGDNTYVTLKIDTQAPDAEFAPGKTIASYLNGPDNYSNYKGFAFVDVAKGKYNLYRKFSEGNPDPHTELALRVLIHGGQIAIINGLQAYGKMSGKCGICGHKLTTPESIALGIGPICAGRLGL